MAKWWKFGLGGGKDKGQGPEETPQEPTPAPAPEPTPAAPAEGGGEKKRGLLGRLFGRGKKKEKAPKEAPPAPTPAPPSAPAGPGGGGEGPAPGEKAGGGGGDVGEGGEGEEAPPERSYPGHLHVDADGIWVISDTEWEGTMSGTLHGQDVKTFIDAMEGEGGPHYDIAIPLVADAYGIPGGLINVSASVIHSVNY
ncbi:hypothetical protein QMK19_39560 [Streptomyces sp. H10-C2]|uniref:hypothetical protein n=1 Tax=unclassified Streptomyces TaxID=2593676 RepID=UPI0024BB7884|nr:MULTISPECIES: hypothetical protein [unclassified Streptomyces]MDJ0347290.1 hypothetical protein [Streptomyces sp. PH10-H1]MDJ0375524.1 hypothetical protein [Streptomyces sp. H10-C2]